MGFIGSALMAILSGGATGLLGIGLQKFFEFLNKKQELELVKVNNAQALALADKETERVKIAGATQVAVADRDLAARTEVAHSDQAAREAEADATIREASYKNDRSSYLTGAVLRSKSRFVMWSMAIVDGFRGLIRPALTAYLVWEVRKMRLDMQAMLDKYGQMLPIATVQDLTTQITVTTLYLATTAVVWWFGTRNPSPVKK